ncbi:outer membrane beta-barrel protein [Pseudoflavitalea rhizosphaerae]|uniref:outer membrane beta-barrel protein n=1 Tax=Pseudoflavitalea rhizosphaerae TaxID=1884793 RepID=UPI000F8F51C6|nr:outer membrane beta-barrel protein [Pseudoflavitalea rhizosphaerae]
MRALYVVVLILIAQVSWAQPAEDGDITITVNNNQQQPLPLASVAILRVKDSVAVKIRMTDSSGKVLFENIPAGIYLFRITMVDHITQYAGPVEISSGNANLPLSITLLRSNASLREVTISARRPLIKFAPDKTIVSVDNSITSTGATVLEVLEKSPGVSVDRDGNVSLKGRSNVLVLIDGKPTYLSGSDLSNLLSGMSASQLEQIELMDNPPSKYDATGNAGVINIKTKKNKQQGFNGTASTAYQQGRKQRSVHSLALNYRQGPLNAFMNYNLNEGGFLMYLYALRKYFDPGTTNANAVLQQPTRIEGNGQNHSLKLGLDYVINKKTSVGILANGFYQYRRTHSKAEAEWLGDNAEKDSVINSIGYSTLNWRNGTVNINARHNFSAEQELTMDLDWLGYNIRNYQLFRNVREGNNGYTEAERGEIPTKIRIITGKADYTQKFGETMKMEAGWKSSRIRTDNFAGYGINTSGSWENNPDKTNQFVYIENIHAAYGNFGKSWEKFTAQVGLRFEHTGYDAEQSGNALRKDSAFSRNYNSLFPTTYLQYKPDSSNSFTISAGRRIDRPVFQNLNPFEFIINKYTSQRGNPFLLPQYTWNFQLSHVYKEWLMTTVSYSRTSDYFAQLFLIKPDGSFLYSYGNVGNKQNFGLSVSVQWQPASWWNMSLQGDLIHKRFKGMLWKELTPTITQFNGNINNQFKFKKGWAAELTAYYITRSQEDIQEVVEPTGQAGAGISKLLFNNKATLKLAFRDIFYTQAMNGLTQFKDSEEYFEIQRDSRVGVLSFTWRFGKTFKGGVKRSGSADDEMRRVGSGG